MFACKDHIKVILASKLTLPVCLAECQSYNKTKTKARYIMVSCNVR